jgi:ABC-type oligopeptide transport system substrate-binding subunit
MMTPSPRLVLSATLLIACLALAGCHSNDNSSQDNSTSMNPPTTMPGGAGNINAVNSDNPDNPNGHNNSSVGNGAYGEPPP